MKPKTTAPSEACPCGATKAYTACCGRWHSAAQYGLAPNAELLMRSRYSAYVLNLTEYLLATWHPATRPASLTPLPDGVRWLGLDVKAVETMDDQHACVEFVARSKLGGKATRHHEISRFEKIDGRWFYRDAAN